MNLRPSTSLSASLAGSLALVTASALLDPVAAQPRYVLVPVDQISADYPLPAQPNGQALTADQASRRCNAGRLIGGLAGGGIGYMASRKDGRSWAVPLGALLGTQMGCPLAQGRGPLSLFGL
ncbi:MAG: glycine zipper 2TM domain-containing protein [Synechococcus sp.]